VVYIGILTFDQTNNISVVGKDYGKNFNSILWQLTFTPSNTCTMGKATDEIGNRRVAER